MVTHSRVLSSPLPRYDCPFDKRPDCAEIPPVFQIVFNEISAAEISRLDTLAQLELLSQFKVTPEDLLNPDGTRFGSLDRHGKKLFRYRARDSRIYFEAKDGYVIVHRVLHKGTFADFLFRTNLGDTDEDAALAGNKHFWKLIDEGAAARRSNP